ncbi:4Fe-4S dicluster domain-containing protein [Thaumasiovibrio sp. DFM-14]|uniref:4Fe-4S dicluster domain-containing protein n=1 Tax=Thaumasiovibrio sp. DFM-14 TaxID=3384792 RepID=UPI0039A1EC36
MKPFLQQLQHGGVVGAGGAGFPTYIKLDCQVDTVIANGAECEPLLNKDQVLMQLHHESLIKGMLLAMAEVGATTGIIGVKKKNTQTIKMLKPHLPSNITLLEMEDVYPAGDEVELVYQATGKRIPAGGLPKDIGIVVNNIESIINTYHASQNVPVTHSMVTVHGEVETPYTADLPIGMSYREAIALAGDILCDDFVVIEGGPMMGSVTTDLSKPITKISSGLLVLRADSRLAKIKQRSDKQVVKMAKSACDQCGQCSVMCPRGLLGYPINPQKVMRTLQTSMDISHAMASQGCCGCNLCTVWSCPEGLDPSRVCGLTKQALGANKRLQPPAALQAAMGDIHPLRAYRGVATKRLMRRLEVLKYYDKVADFRADIPAVERVIIPLSQHIGRPAEPIVSVGDMVTKGQMLAKPASDSLSVAVHASIDGQVVSVGGDITIEYKNK